MTSIVIKTLPFVGQDPNWGVHLISYDSTLVLTQGAGQNSYERLISQGEANTWIGMQLYNANDIFLGNIVSATTGEFGTYGYPCIRTTLDSVRGPLNSPFIIRKNVMTFQSNVSTLAGNGTAGFMDGSGTNVMFDQPCHITLDASNNVIVTDKGNKKIRKITPEGIVTTLVSNLSSPTSAVFDTAGNMYICDGNSIKKLDTSNNITILTSSSSSTNISIDANGILYLSDYNNNSIKKIGYEFTQPLSLGSRFTLNNETYFTSQDINKNENFRNNAAIYVKAPNVNEPLKLMPILINMNIVRTKDSTITSLPIINLNTPRWITITPSNTLFISTQNGLCKYSGPNTSYINTYPNVGGLTSDSTHLYIISGLIIKKIRQTDMGEVWSYTGFTNVVGIAVNKSGTIYVTGNNNIYKIPSTGGSYQTFVSGLYSPKGISVGKNDYIYVADTNNHVIRQITPDGTSSIIAGDLGIEGFEDKLSLDGPPAQFRYPTGIYVDQNDNIFVTDQGNKRIRLIDSNRLVTTIAGTNMDGFTNTNPLLTSLSIPTGITMDASNNLYIVETGANRVQKMNIQYMTIQQDVLAATTTGTRM
jgi:hypothetical protein